MKRIVPVLPIVILIAAGFACQAGPTALITPTLVETDACCLNKQQGLQETLTASWMEATGTPVFVATHLTEPLAPPVPAIATAAAPAETPPPNQEERLPQLPEPGFFRQGALFGALDPYAVDDIAIGGYRPDFPGCGDPSLADLPEESGEIVLTLRYAIPVIPEQIAIFSAGPVAGIRRVEVLHTQSGLGREIYQGRSSLQPEALIAEACAEKQVLPVEVDFEVDTVVITFEDPVSVSRVGAVVMAGSLAGYVEAPVYWRVPLPGSPVDLAAGPGGMVYAATAPNRLEAYDVEGNRLRQLSTLDEGEVTGLAVDLSGSLVILQSDDRFSVLSPEGETRAVSNQASSSFAAVHPTDGSLYLLEARGIAVYTMGAAAFVRVLPLDALHSYTGLAFDRQGRLYTLRDFDWSATLVELDPLTGEERGAILLDRSEQVDVVARDLAIDGGGNFYVLFRLNVGQIAVHMFDAQGNLLRRFGLLADGVENRPEGSFFDPRAITVTPDGRFIIIADGYDQSAYLTAFFVETD